MVDDVTNLLREALAASRHPDRVLAVVAGLMAWFIVVVLKAVCLTTTARRSFTIAHNHHGDDDLFG